MSDAVFQATRSSAEKLLESTERKLEKNSEIADAYQKIVQDNLGEELHPPSDTRWTYAHHRMVTSSFFSHARWKHHNEKDRGSCLMRQLRFRERVLTVNEALLGPKLQENMFSIPVRFWKELVALVGDISQMYHQLALTLEDRPLHRFLWRNLDQSKEPNFKNSCDTCSEGVIVLFVRSMYGRNKRMIIKQSTLELRMW